MDAFAMPPASADDQNKDGADPFDLTPSKPEQHADRTPVKRKLFEVGEESESVLLESFGQPMTSLLDSPGKQSSAADSVQTLVADDCSSTNATTHSNSPKPDCNGSAANRNSSKPVPRKQPQQHFVDDFSDPLHAFKDGVTSHPADSSLTLTEVSRPGSGANFKAHLSELLLSVSPYLRHDVPYLESASGSRSDLKKFLPAKLYYSAQFEERSDVKHMGGSINKEEDAKRKSSTSSLEGRDVIKTARDRVQANGVHAFQTAQLNGAAGKTFYQVKYHFNVCTVNLYM